MPGKKLSRFLRNEKARAQVLSGVVVALMMISAFTGLFLMSERASAATVISHDFEVLPGTGWIQAGASNVEQNSTITHGGTYSGRVHITSTADTAYLENASISVPDTAATLKAWVYVDSLQSTYQILMRISCSTTDVITVTINETGHPRIGWKDENIEETEVISTNTTIDLDTWVEIRVVLDNGNLSYYVNGSKALNLTYTTGDTFNNIDIGDKSTTTTDDYFMDDFTLTNTADYPGAGSTPNAPTGATATAYTKFDITLSGYDGNSRFNFSVFNTNDTAGDTTWSNSTTYGIAKITNAGVQQINLSWTKGTGATNTYIEWNTVSSWSRGAGTLLYNNTGTSAILENIPAGATRYFELWSWNASGFSSTYATTSATAGNASVTNLTIHMEDGGTGNALLPKENITLYGNGTGTFASLGAFDATTGNITLTTTYAGLPLAIGDSLYFEFKSVIGPGAQPNGTYYDKNAETLDCNVYAWR